ncbi:MAG: hypothetical protein ACR2RF_31355 [Geminicoccaceae bacterium]
MKTAIKEGVKEGVDAARMSTMMRELVDKLGGDPIDLRARVEALETHVEWLAGVVREHGDLLERHRERLERHRLRIRWLERWAHIHWPRFFSRPGL